MNLFVYGTLLFPEIRKALLRKDVSLADALAIGFRVITPIVNNKPWDYPVLIRATDKVSGKILLNLTPEDMRHITAYEGNEYRLVDCPVLANGLPVPAKTFMATEETESRFEDYISGWDQEKFRLENLSSYLEELAHAIHPKR